jgi:N-acetyltransferase 10
MIMLSALKSDRVEGTAWLQPFLQDFRTRFLTLLAGAYKVFAPALALSILDPKLSFSETEIQTALKAGSKVLKADGNSLSTYDLKRLQVPPPLPSLK